MNYYRFKAFIFVFFSLFSYANSAFSPKQHQNNYKKEENFVAGGFTTNRKTIYLFDRF